MADTRPSGTPVSVSPAGAQVAGFHITILATIGAARYSAATQAGINARVDAAEAILARRMGDGSDMPHLPYTLPPGPGVYQPTPNPEFPAVITPSFATAPRARRLIAQDAHLSRTASSMRL